MLEIIGISVIAHCALIAVIVVDWLRFKKFNAFLDVLFWVIANGQYIIVSGIITRVSGYDIVTQIFITCLIYALVYIVLPKDKGDSL